MQPKSRSLSSFAANASIAMAISISFAHSPPAQGQESCLAGTCLDESATSSCRDGRHDGCLCDGPGTLIQWSYGTSFEGGPDRSAPLVTDRPDFTEATSTVGIGVAQLEIGYTYTFDNDGATTTKSHGYPEALLRYGLMAEWLELRVVWSYAGFEAGNTNVSGSQDLGLGLKIALTPQEGILPEMAIIPQMSVPTGSNALSADEVLPGVNWVYGWALSDCISTAGSTQFNRALDETTSVAFTEWAQSWTVAYSLTDQWGGYTEWFAFFPHSATTALPEHYFNGGFTYLLCNDVQLDFRGGVGLNDAADDYFVGSGLSIRFH
jgi:hypothetical protein